MNKLSGLILDVYDDVRGELFKEIFPTKVEVPELVKSAYLLTEDERRTLPDDVFALVLRDGDVTLRKFACIDPGNVALSMLYFEKTAQRLPYDAKMRAVENLLIADGWYKTAGIGGALASGLGGLGGKLVGWAGKNPMKALSTGLSGYMLYGGAKDIGGRLKNVAPAEQAAGGFGQLVRT
jgi:hypothetical protein